MRNKRLILERLEDTFVVLKIGLAESGVEYLEDPTNQCRARYE